MAARADGQIELDHQEIDFLWLKTFGCNPVEAGITKEEAMKGLILVLGADMICEELEDAGFSIRHSLD